MTINWDIWHCGFIRILDYDKIKNKKIKESVINGCIDEISNIGVNNG